MDGRPTTVKQRATFLRCHYFMKLLVIGGTGPTGREIVSQALAQGHAVTVLARDPAKAHFGPAVTKAIGNVLEPDTLEQALKGQGAVISALGSAATGPFKQMTLLSEGTRNLVAAMRSLGVGRLVCITGVGAGESKGHGPWYYNWLIQPLVLRGVYEDKTRQEEIVRASGLAWTLVRPALLTNGPAQGREAVRAFTELDGIRARTICRADVAAFCLHELVDGHYQRQAPVISY
jgi:uncharacterized protein YbjT (DUF2867 family)